jgi:hypothetical protein
MTKAASDMTSDGETPMEQRIAAVERRASVLEKRMDDFADEIRKNTETTNSIKQDTSQIIAFFKASQLGASIVKWCATVGGGLIIAYASYKGMTGR